MEETTSFFLAGAAAGTGDFLDTDLFRVGFMAASLARSSTSDISMTVSWDPREMDEVMDTVEFILAVFALAGLSFS